MTSGIPKAAASMMLAAAWLAASPASHATPPDAAQLVARLKRDVPARTAYTEVRFSGMLDRPLILRGEMEYLGNGRLAKRVDAPYHEQTTVENGTATMQRGDKPGRSISLAQIPELESFLRGFSALLGGDVDTLARDFTLDATGGDARWQITLKPRDARLARRVESIRVDGAGNEPLCFRTHEADGDDSALLVGPLSAATLAPRVSTMQIDALCRGVKP